MTNSLNPTGAQFLTSLARIEQQSSRAQLELSSGVKIQYAADAPDQISQLLQLEAELASNRQTGKNLTNVQAGVNTSESTLESAVQLVQNAASTGAEGASGTATAASRQTLAQQIQGIQEQLVGLANTTAAGHYIFSGDQDTQASYQLNLNNPNGVNRLITPSSTRQIQDAEGNSFAVSETAQTIFDHRNADDSLAPDNVFAALNSLRVALNNNDTPGISTALDSLNTASAYLNTQLGFYGQVQNRVQAAVTDSQNQDVSLKSQISAIRDADLAQATLDLTSATTERQAALGAEAQIPRTSLFSFLG